MSISLTLPGGYSFTLTPPPPSDLEVAQAFHDGCNGVGVNVERGHWRELSYNGQPIAASPTYWRYLRSLGVSHVRFFLPYGFSGAGARLQQADVAAFMVPISAAIAAGLRVLCDLTDVLALAEAQTHATEIEAYLAMAAGVVAAQGFAVGSIAIGAVNEPAGDSNVNWAPYLADYAALLRSMLPNHVLIGKGCNWAYYGHGLNNYDQSAGLADLQPLSDLRVIYDVHDYDSSSVGASADAAATWATAANVCAAWSATNGGRPVLMGEFGWQDPAGIVACAQGAAALRPMAWTITSGTGGRLNASSTDASIPPAIAAALAQAACIIRAAA